MIERLAIGIDLGGTGIKLGVVNAQGTMSQTFRFMTPSKSDPAQVAAMIIEEAEALIRTVGRNRIVGIGIGAAGDVDPDNGVIRLSPNLNWRHVPLKKMLQRRLKFRITVENDANVAAWAAYVVEAKRKVDNLLCITLGTGIGGGIVLGGKLFRGATGTAGEIGHMTLYPEGIPCNCGNNGCLERYVGARAMVEEARRAIEKGETTIIPKLIGHDVSRLNPLSIDQAARQGDRVALALWQQSGERLGIALASVINILNPHMIVLAGGLSRARRLLLDPLQRTILQRAFPTPAKEAKLVISKLDQDLGIVGAGLVAHELQQ